ncbi:MAG: glycosyltransferase family 2 protein [Acidimicrobiia bacterium]|nr:glycosyltransferase family 2 protein [Acidimicrobiia bacterium]
MTNPGPARPIRLAVLGTLLVVVAVLGVPRALTVLAAGLEVLFVAFFLRHFAFAVAAQRSAPGDLSAPVVVDPSYAPTVSVIVACHNERSVVDGLVEAVLALDYPPSLLQLVVVDDRSEDGTGARLDELARDHGSRLRVLHRAPDGVGGKSAALNDALSVATGEIIVVFDADHQPRADVVRRLVAHFAEPTVGAVQGRCEIRNASDSPLSHLIAIDYRVGYLVNEYGRQALFHLPAYGGANCAVRASSLRAAGGWNPASVTEDTDLTLRLLLRGERVRFDVNAVDREEGVVTLGRFWRQRYRWARGHQQAWRDYRRLVWATPHLTFAEKVETTMFLFVFHLPVAAAIGLALVTSWITGVAAPSDPLNLFVFWTLLFLGPMLELGGGLLVAGAERRNAVAVVYFLPLFLVSMALCTKAWADSLLGREYGWVKTARAGDGLVAA